MTDLEEMRKRYGILIRCGKCLGIRTSAPGDLCDSCGHDTWMCQADPSVLALCEEVEALRIRVAAAPEVLREWPKTAEDAPGEWFYCIHGDFAPRGKFEQREGYTIPVFFEECLGRVWVFGEMKPGEFFVRVP